MRYKRGAPLHRQIQAGRAAGYRPRLDVEPHPEPRPEPSTLRTRPPVERSDWPAIPSAHPTWWQVHRIEIRNGQPYHVLIAERRTEQDGFAVVLAQLHQCSLSRLGDRRASYLSLRDPLVVDGGADR